MCARLCFAVLFQCIGTGEDELGAEGFQLIQEGGTIVLLFIIRPYVDRGSPKPIFEVSDGLGKQLGDLRPKLESVDKDKGRFVVPNCEEVPITRGIEGKWSKDVSDKEIEWLVEGNCFQYYFALRKAFCSLAGLADEWGPCFGVKIRKVSLQVQFYHPVRYMAKSAMIKEGRGNKGKLGERKRGDRGPGTGRGNSDRETNATEEMEVITQDQLE